MSFRIQGLRPIHFAPLRAAPPNVLAARGVERHTVTAKPGAPCRITLEDAEIGETVLLLNHRHLDVATPYAQSGPIFIREAAVCAYDAADVIPPALAQRVLSVRAFNIDGTMIDADLCEGAELASLITRFFDNPSTAFLHGHFAKRGCFAAAITRA